MQAYKLAYENMSHKKLMVLWKKNSAASVQLASGTLTADQIWNKKPILFVWEALIKEPPGNAQVFRLARRDLF